MVRILGAGAALLVVVAGLAPARPDDRGGAGLGNLVDARGSIRLPRDLRAKWAHLGSWVVAEKKADGHGFHDVYTQPETVEAFRKTGKFPDGAVIVKEIREIETDALTTGRASRAGKPKVWFVMVRDRKGRFPGNPNWGDGWGWALFKANDPRKNVSTGYRKDCLRCHRPAKDTDWVYVKGYPTLK